MALFVPTVNLPAIRLALLRLGVTDLQAKYCANAALSNPGCDYRSRLSYVLAFKWMAGLPEARSEVRAALCDVRT